MTAPIDLSEERVIAWLKLREADWRATAERSGGCERDKCNLIADAYARSARHIREGRHRG